MQATIRSKFEDWAKDKASNWFGYNDDEFDTMLLRDGEGYIDANVHSAWMAWKDAFPELGMVLKGADPHDVIEYLKEDINLQTALWYWFMAEEGNDKAREKLEIMLGQM